MHHLISISLVLFYQLFQTKSRNGESEYRLYYNKFWNNDVIIFPNDTMKCNPFDNSDILCQWTLKDHRFEEHHFIDYIFVKDRECIFEAHQWLIDNGLQSDRVVCSFVGNRQRESWLIDIQMRFQLSQYLNYSLNPMCYPTQTIYFKDYVNKTTDSIDPYICTNNDKRLRMFQLHTFLPKFVFIYNINVIENFNIILSKINELEQISVFWNNKRELTQEFIVQHQLYWLEVKVDKLLKNNVTLGIINVAYDENGMNKHFLNIILRIELNKYVMDSPFRVSKDHYPRNSTTYFEVFFSKEEKDNNNFLQFVSLESAKDETLNRDKYLIKSECILLHCFFQAFAIFPTITQNHSSSNQFLDKDDHFSDYFKEKTTQPGTRKLVHQKPEVVLSLTLILVVVFMCLVMITVVGIVTFLWLRNKNNLCFQKFDMRKFHVNFDWITNEKYRLCNSLIWKTSSSNNPHIKEFTQFNENATEMSIVFQSMSDPLLPNYSELMFPGTSGEESFPSFIGDIKEDSINVIKCIGNGEFGQVFLAEIDLTEGNKIKRRKIAVKEMINNFLDHMESDTTDLFREMSIMKDIGYHSNIVTVIGYCPRKHKTDLLVMEYCSNGSLKSFLDRLRRENQCPVETFLRFSYETAVGMEYLSSKNIIHRDLAARNVLLSENYACKISDFGLSRQLPVNETYYRNLNGTFPIKWIAPEVFIRNKYSLQADVWSYGILLWEIYSVGSIPYEKISTNQIICQISSGYRMPIPDCCPVHIADLITQCWNFEARDRPNFKCILERYYL